MKNFLFIVAVLAGLGGCGAQKIFVKAYSGEDRPANQLALLKPVIGIVIESIDGEFSRGIATQQPFGYLDADIAVLPGTHVIKVAYSYGGGPLSVSSRGSLTINFTAERGHRYILRAEFLSNRWTPIIIDVTDRNECWEPTRPRGSVALEKC